jgi:hypothetical protein
MMDEKRNVHETRDAKLKSGSCDLCSIAFTLRNPHSILIIHTMSTTTLPWKSMILANTQLHALSGELRQESIQWHSEGSVLYIVMENQKEVDLRMDREIFDVRVCHVLLSIATYPYVDLTV